MVVACAAFELLFGQPAESAQIGEAGEFVAQGHLFESSIELAHAVQQVEHDAEDGQTDAVVPERDGQRHHTEVEQVGNDGSGGGAGQGDEETIEGRSSPRRHHHHRQQVEDAQQQLRTTGIVQACDAGHDGDPEENHQEVAQATALPRGPS